MLCLNLLISLKIILAIIFLFILLQDPYPLESISSIKEMLLKWHWQAFTHTVK